MIKNTTRLLLLFTVFSFTTSCTFFRTVRYFKPSTLDHEKIFVCDTVRGASYANYASVDNKGNSNKSLFINANDEQNIPSIEQWIPPVYCMDSENLEEYLTKSKTTAFMVIRNDSILYQKYLNGGSEEQARIVFSVTKAITAMLVAIAQEEGLMNMNDKAAQYIPEFAQDGRKDIRIEHLVNMNSGLKWLDHDNVIKLGFLYYNKNQEKFIIKNAKLAYEPGTHHAYQSLSTQILGICLERAIGKGIAEYLEEKIWQPIGMEHDSYITLDSRKQEHARTFGGMAITAANMARLGKLLLNEGKWEDKQIIPTWFMEQLQNRSMDGKNWGNDLLSFKRNGYEDIHYQYNQQYFASGYLGQYIFVDKRHNMLVIRQGDEEDASWKMFMGRLTSLLGEGRNDLTDEKLDFGTQFAGTYATEAGEKMTFTLNEKDEFDRLNWTWERDVKRFSYHKKIAILSQHDGVSFGYKTGGHYTRFFADIKEDKVVGLYYNYRPNTKTLYLKKLP